MGINSKIGKLFGVLVVGGAMMAQANESLDSQLAEESTFCQLELNQTKYDSSGAEASKTATCLDKKTDVEALQIIKKLRKENCVTPFCGCWLG